MGKLENRKTRELKINKSNENDKVISTYIADGGHAGRGQTLLEQGDAGTLMPHLLVKGGERPVYTQTRLLGYFSDFERVL